MEQRHFDVLVVGAGISGISAAYHLQTLCKEKSFAILEGRAQLGGTWDLFRYPGIRSDSDMYTLGYSFRPWTNAKAIADGPSILQYVRETAEAYGIDKKIHYNRFVKKAKWSSRDSLWTIEVLDVEANETIEYSCSFLLMCSGYYDYDEGYTPEFKGSKDFEGRIVHPQKWTEDIDYEGKKVVVIGSGATAVTLVPSMAQKAAHVTMLQRSPTYIMSAPEQDVVANWLREHIPPMAAYTTTRWKNVLLSMAFFNFCRRFPAQAKKLLLSQVKKQLGTLASEDFTPSYNPWDQRLCLVPDGDLFDALKSGKASVVTGHIDCFTKKGIKLVSGQEIEADLIVTATGLKLKFLGGMTVEVDGKRIEPSETMTYKGMMCSDVPNLALAIGYTNASWTLKCDLTCEYVCRLLNHMSSHGYTQCCPRRTDPTVKEAPLLDFSSGYVVRALDKLPKQGSVTPWKLYQNYAFDMFTLRHSKVEDGVMEFRKEA